MHTAWSGNHVHYAERVSTGEQRARRRRAAAARRGPAGDAARRYTSPWLYGVVRRRPRRGRAGASTATCGPAPPPGLGRPTGHAQRLGGGLLRPRPRPAASTSPSGPPRSASSATCSTTAGSAPAATTAPGSATGSSRRRSGPTGCTRWSTGSRELGMQFGLWFEPEMVNPDSDVARAHPEWIMAARRRLAGRVAPPAGAQPRHPGGVRARQAARSWRSLDEYDIGYIKWDHNRDLIDAGTQPTAAGPACTRRRWPSTGCSTRSAPRTRAWRSSRARPAAPGSTSACWSATDRVWVSDCIDPHERQQMLRWTAQLIPPELMGAHIASGRSHTTGRRPRPRLPGRHRRSSATSASSGTWPTASRVGARRAAASGSRSTRRNRDLLLGGDLVRMDTHDDNLFVHGVVSPTGSEAIFAMVVLGSLDASPGDRIRFRGLDPRRPLSPAAAPRRVPTRRSARPGVGGVPGPDHPGVVLSGAAIEHVGVAAPIVHPDQVVLLHAERL